MGASSSAINPTQDFLARMGGGRLFEVGASAVKYGICLFLVVRLEVLISLRSSSMGGGFFFVDVGLLWMLLFPLVF